MATPFDGNPLFRKYTYKAQWLVNGALAVLGAYFLSQHGQDITAYPSWYLTAAAVLPVLWTYLGVQADTNTPAPDPGDGGYVRNGNILNSLGVLLIALAVLLGVLTALNVFVVTIPVLVVLFVVGLALVLIF